MMPESGFENKKLANMVSPLRPVSSGLGIAFPDLGWNLKKAGYKIDAILFLSIALFVSLMVFTFGFVLMILLWNKGALGEGTNGFLIAVTISVVLGVAGFFYVMLLPSLKVSRNKRGVDKNLEYMLKDMQIQLTAGIPLFDIFVNIGSGGYGECSVICNRVVQDVQSGKSIVNVLDEFGLLSPSEYMRRVFWQIVNALKTGSNVGISLKMISQEIREDKQNKITSYSQELGLWSLVYMIFVIVLPSMGVTLILILSSFLGTSMVSEMIFWLILIFVSFFQVIFISIIRNKRPDIG
jgi:pilus assembly protein TadC